MTHPQAGSASRYDGCGEVRAAIRCRQTPLGTAIRDLLSAALTPGIAFLPLQVRSRGGQDPLLCFLLDHATTLLRGLQHEPGDAGSGERLVAISRDFAANRGGTKASHQLRR